MSSWLNENIKYEKNITRNDILDDMFFKLLNYLRSTELILCCDDESLRVSFLEYIYKYYYKNESLSIHFDDNYDWIDQLYSQDLSEIFKELVEMDNHYLTDIFRYKTHDKLLDFISYHYICEELLEPEDNNENNFYQNIDEERI
tara:strand:+ start:384 stop:815 length:432 start_codon:yes stop_codon:yes gene_type:complete